MANEYQGFSVSDWARSAATTLADHVKEVEPAWMRNFQMGALLESQGRIEYNCGGRGFDWPVQYKKHAMEGNTGETARNFVRTNLWQQARLQYRGYQATDSIFKKELLENRGEAAVVKVFDNFTGRIEKSIKEGLAAEYFIDGNATGNEQMWHGLESMFGTNGTVNVDTGAQRSANAGDKVGYPSDTYAALSTVLGNYGGENESGAVWPDGIADPEYDFWSPLIVCYNSSAFGGTADTWAAQGDEAMRYMILHAQRNASIDGQMTNIFLARGLYFELMNLFDSKEQINISQENELRALGFKNTIVFDGVTVSWEAGVPTGVGYGLNFNNMTLKCMEDSIFKTEGPEYDIDSQSFNAVVYTLSNLKFASPRNFGKLMTIAS